MWYYMYPDTAAVKDLPYYLSSIGQHDLQPRIVKPGGDACDQFFFNTRGTGTLILQGKRHHLSAGCGFFIPAGIPHEYYPNGSVWDIRWMCPGGAGLPLLYQKLNLTGGVYPLRDVGGLQQRIHKMREALLDNSPYGIYFASSLVLEYLIEFAKQGVRKDAPPAKEGTGKDAGKSAYQRQMSQLSDYINYHFMTQITEAELCNLLGITPQHLCRIVRSCTGMRPTEYINHVRIQHAKRYLVDTDCNATQIAQWCGYTNNNYFWRIFKKETGLSPCAYRADRKPYQETEQINSPSVR